MLKRVTNKFLKHKSDLRVSNVFDLFIANCCDLRPAQFLRLSMWRLKQKITYPESMSCLTTSHNSCLDTTTAPRCWRLTPAAAELSQVRRPAQKYTARGLSCILWLHLHPPWGSPRCLVFWTSQLAWMRVGTVGWRGARISARNGICFYISCLTYPRS